MSYTDQLTALGAATESKVLRLFDRYVDGNLTPRQFVATTATVIAKANGRAVAMADLSLASTLSAKLGVPITALGLIPPAGDIDRLLKAATTLVEVIDETPDPRARVARLGRVEPLDAAGTAYSEAIKRSGHVSGYRRGVSPGACELCNWLAKTNLDPAGYIYPANKPMNRHKGCTCTQIPV